MAFIKMPQNFLSQNDSIDLLIKKNVMCLFLALEQILFNSCYLITRNNFSKKSWKQKSELAKQKHPANHSNR